MKIIIEIILISCIGINNFFAQSKENAQQFTESLMQEECSFKSSGKNNYFILEPGYQEILGGKDGDDSVTLIITVLDETKMIGNVETRIVVEDESANGNTIEISRNFFAFCEQTSSIYYFGEEVDIYKNGKVVSHEGEWVAGDKNQPGLAMPALILLGARYYQEIAPGLAMDRAEIISTTESMKTPAGNFTNVLKIKETTPLEPKEFEYKYYAPGIGLIKDEDLLLVKAGFIK